MKALRNHGNRRNAATFVGLLGVGTTLTVVAADEITLLQQGILYPNQAKQLAEPAGAAERSNVATQLALAKMYHSGQGAEADIHRAIYWYGQAARGGNPEAQFQLGLIYLYGKEVDEDEDLAMDWIGKAAAQNHAEAVVLYNYLLHNPTDIGC